MDKFCLITNREKDQNLEITAEIVSYMKKHKKDCILLDSYQESSQTPHYTDVTSIPDDTQCIIVLGGDGTIIQAAHDLAERNIPILGINLGTLGFLAEIELHNLYEALNGLFREQWFLDNRMMISGSIKRNKNKVYSGNALNDIVVTRSGFSRIISVSIYVNDELVNRYRGDGVIISTPTGSTGYNLSSGGPVVKPDSQVMIITPICPHSLNSRSIVLDAQDVIRIKIDESKKTQEDEAIATFDGREAILLQAEDIIEIGKAKVETRLVKINHTNFFEILRTKIG
jgi:NAD+ kinase